MQSVRRAGNAQPVQSAGNVLPVPSVRKRATSTKRGKTCSRCTDYNQSKRGNTVGHFLTNAFFKFPNFLFSVPRGS